MNKQEELVTICHRFTMLKHSSSLPHAFTEHGVAMLASVLRGKLAVKISIHIVKTFIRLRELVSTSKELARKMIELEKKIGRQDEDIKTIIDLIKELHAIPEEPKRKIGFHA